MPQNQSKSAGLRGTLEDMLRELDGLHKSASEPSTTHPTGKAPDGNVDPSMGELGNSMNSQLKKNEPVNIETASPSPASGQAEAQANSVVGPIHAKPVGEDKGVERDFKGTKDDPGTGHAAATDNKELGGKFSSDNNPLEKVAQDFLAALTAFAGEEKQASAPAPVPGGDVAAEKAGADLASLFLGGNLTSEQKQASDNDAIEKTVQAYSYGVKLADDYMSWRVGFTAEHKEANDGSGAGGMGVPPQPAAPPMAPPMPGGDQGAAQGGEQSIPPEILAMLLQAQQQGGGAGGAGAPPPAGDGDADDVGAAMQGAEGGGGGEDVAALIEAAMAQQGAEGGAPGGAAPPPEAKAAGYSKAASILKTLPRESRKKYANVYGVVRELLSRGA